MNTTIVRHRLALLIIDMQNDFVMSGAPAFVYGAYDSIDSIRKLLDYYRLIKEPVFHVIREYRSDGSDVEITRYESFIKNRKIVVPGTDGCKIVEKLKPAEGEYVIIKNRFSAFMNTELDFMLRRLGITDIAICGTQFPNCIRATAFDAVSYGYNVTVIKDATSAASKQIAEANITDIQNIGIPCITVDEYIKKMNI